MKLLQELNASQLLMKWRDNDFQCIYSLLGLFYTAIMLFYLMTITIITTTITIIIIIYEEQYLKQGKKEALLLDASHM